MLRFGVLILSLILLAGCQSEEMKRRTEEKERQANSSIFGGERGINLTKLMRGEGGIGGSSRDNGGGAALKANKFLWRGSLQTLSFLPIKHADPASGFIQTEWYASSPDERLRIEAFILGPELQTESLVVAIHSQIATGEGWQSVPTAERTTRAVENAILLKARQLKVAELQTSDR